MWPQNGNSDSQVDIDTAGDRASKYSSFRMYVDSDTFFKGMCDGPSCFFNKWAFPFINRQSRAWSVLSGLESIHLDTTTMARVTCGAKALCNRRSQWHKVFSTLFWKVFVRHRRYPFQEQSSFEGEQAVRRHIAIRLRCTPTIAWRVRQSWRMWKRELELTYFQNSI